MNKILFTLVLVASVFVTSLQAQQKSPPSSAKKANTESSTKLVVVDQNLKDKLKDAREELSTENPKVIEDALFNIDLLLSYDQQSNDSPIGVEGGEEETATNSESGGGIQFSIIRPITAIISDGPSSILMIETVPTKDGSGDNDDIQGIQDNDDIEQGLVVIKDIRPIDAIISLDDDDIEQESVIKDIKPITGIIILFQPNGGEQDTNHQNYLDGEGSEEDEAEEEHGVVLLVEEEEENTNDDNDTNNNNNQAMCIPTQEAEDQDFEFLNTSLNSTELVGELLTEIKAYPNPATDFVTLEFSKKGHYDINVFNVLGQMKQTFQTGQTNAYQIDVANWIPGDYIIQIIQGNELITKRVVVTR